MSDPAPLDVALVLVNPQHVVNIASAARIAKNFGIGDFRLVEPQEDYIEAMIRAGALAD